MYLFKLNDIEKECFLNLAYIAASIDGKVSDEEKEALIAYEMECGFQNFIPKFKVLDSAIKLVDRSSRPAKAAILMELMGIWTADNKWHELELEMMYSTGKQFGFSKEAINRMKDKSEELSKVIDECFELIEV